MTDQQLTLEAVCKAQRILEEYLDACSASWLRCLTALIVLTILTIFTFGIGAEG
jgi:hypothetical protein